MHPTGVGRLTCVGPQSTAPRSRVGSSIAISRLSKWSAYVILSRLLFNALPPPSPTCTSLLSFFFWRGLGFPARDQRNLPAEHPVPPLFPLLYPPPGLKSFNWVFDISFENICILVSHWNLLAVVFGAQGEMCSLMS